MQANNRRFFFKAVLNNCISLIDELRGSPQFRIESLWELDRETLEKIIPRICPDISIKIENNCVFTISDNGTQLTEILKLNSQNAFVFDLIDGQNTISSIASRAHDEFELPTDEVYQFVRGFFLDLVKQGICIPGNNVGKREWVNDDKDG